jgi:hypothetical protein
MKSTGKDTQDSVQRKLSILKRSKQMENADDEADAPFASSSPAQEIAARIDEMWERVRAGETVAQDVAQEGQGR